MHLGSRSINAVAHREKREGGGVVRAGEACTQWLGLGLGQSNLQGGVVAIEANHGNGHVFLFGPEITFRGEPHATFPFLFNAIYYSEAEIPGPTRANS